MALQLGALNQALREAGVSEDLARQAAEEVAASDNRLAAVERQLVEIRASIEAVGTELRAMRWVLGFVVAIQRAMFVKLFVH